MVKYDDPTKDPNMSNKDHRFGILTTYMATKLIHKILVFNFQNLSRALFLTFVHLSKCNIKSKKKFFMNQSKGHRLNYWLSEFTPWEMPRLHRLFNNLLLNIQRMPLTLAGWRTHSLKIVFLHKAKRD